MSNQPEKFLNSYTHHPSNSKISIEVLSLVMNWTIHFLILKYLGNPFNTLKTLHR